MRGQGGSVYGINLADAGEQYGTRRYTATTPNNTYFTLHEGRNGGYTWSGSLPGGGTVSSGTGTRKLDTPEDAVRDVLNAEHYGTGGLDRIGELNKEIEKLRSSAHRIGKQRQIAHGPEKWAAVQPKIDAKYAEITRLRGEIEKNRVAPEFHLPEPTEADRITSKPKPGDKLRLGSGQDVWTMVRDDHGGIRLENENKPGLSAHHVIVRADDPNLYRHPGRPEPAKSARTELDNAVDRVLGGHASNDTLRQAVHTYTDPRADQGDRASAHRLLDGQRNTDLVDRAAVLRHSRTGSTRGRFEHEHFANELARVESGDETHPIVAMRKGTPVRVGGVNHEYVRGGEDTYHGRITAVTPAVLGTGADRRPTWLSHVETHLWDTHSASGGRDADYRATREAVPTRSQVHVEGRSPKVEPIEDPEIARRAEAERRAAEHNAGIREKIRGEFHPDEEAHAHGIDFYPGTGGHEGQSPLGSTVVIKKRRSDGGWEYNVDNPEHDIAAYHSSYQPSFEFPADAVHAALKSERQRALRPHLRELENRRDQLIERMRKADSAYVKAWDKGNREQADRHSALGDKYRDQLVELGKQITEEDDKVLSSGEIAQIRELGQPITKPVQATYKGRKLSVGPVSNGDAVQLSVSDIQAEGSFINTKREALELIERAKRKIDRLDQGDQDVYVSGHGYRIKDETGLPWAVDEKRNESAEGSDHRLTITKERHGGWHYTYEHRSALKETGNGETGKIRSGEEWLTKGTALDARKAAKEELDRIREENPFNVSNAGIETRSRINEAMQRITAGLPRDKVKALGGLHVVYGPLMSRNAKGDRDVASGSHAHYDPLDKGIRVRHDRLFGDRAEHTLHRDRANGWHTDSGTETMHEDVLAHEFGHHLHYELTPEQNAAMFKELSDEIGGAPYVPPMALEKIWNSKAAEEFVKNNRARIINRVSEYGATNSREMVAELNAEYHGRREKASKLAQIVGKYLSTPKSTEAEG